MKKLMAVFVLCLAVVTLTGCGSKNLTCSRIKKGEEAKMTFTFKDGKAVTIKRLETLEYDTEAAANQIKTSAEGSLGSNKPEYLEYEITVDGKKTTMLLTFDITKMSEQEINQQFGDNLGTLSYDDIKKAGESEGFRCE